MPIVSGRIVAPDMLIAPPPLRGRFVPDMRSASLAHRIAGCIRGVGLSHYQLLPFPFAAVPW
jgi:hypothetical protein